MQKALEASKTTIQDVSRMPKWVLCSLGLASRQFHAKSTQILNFWCNTCEVHPFWCIKQQLLRRPAGSAAQPALFLLSTPLVIHVSTDCILSLHPAFVPDF